MDDVRWVKHKRLGLEMKLFKPIPISELNYVFSYIGK